MQKPLHDYSECDHVASADLEIGRQVVRPCLGEMELDKDISLSLSLSVSCIGILLLSLFSNSPEASAGNSLPFRVLTKQLDNDGAQSTALLHVPGADPR